MMLEEIGAESVEALFDDIPEEYRHPALSLPEPMPELQLRAEMEALAQRNFHAGDHPCFLGAGVYRHFCPSAVAPLVTRGEFLTSYTPYQPEVSQGTLQGTYEFQTMTAQLFGMEVSNAGMYDGASSLAEAALMACRLKKRSRVAILETVNPRYIETVRAYARPQGIEIYTVGSTAITFQEGTACLLAQYPNFFGYFEDMKAMSIATHEADALFVMSCDPIALAMFNDPGSIGADIATGEGQALGVPASFGGPYVGIFTCRQEYIRQLPGRIVGQTADTHGRTGYVLTLQPREQHIRREHATSNICTSTALIGLWATVYTALMGKHGLRHVANLCYQKAHYAATEIAAIPGYSLPVSDPFFQEFVVTCPKPAEEISIELEHAGIIGGLDVSAHYPNGMLFCVSELNSKREIDRLVQALKSITEPW
jgi:glycine dehydrogenase subunit 1